MERYMMNRPGYRSVPQSQPMRQTCPMPSRISPAMPCQEEKHMPPRKNSMYDHVDHMIPAMAYIPYQSWQEPFDLCRALCVGTLFPDLCKPFCGRRDINR